MAKITLNLKQYMEEQTPLKTRSGDKAFIFKFNRWHPYPFTRLTQAEALAKQQVLQADAEAHAIRVKGDAEAENVRKMAEALAKNQELVALETAKRWDGKLPTYIPQGTVMPFVQLPQK